MSRRLLAWAQRWFDPETVARFFEPLIADWQHEYQVAAGPWSRIVATIRGAATFLFVAFWMTPRRLCAPIPMPVALGALRGSTLFLVPVTLLLMLPYLLKWTEGPPPAEASFFWFAYLLPSTVALALPFAMVIIVDRIRLDRQTPDYEKPRLVAQFTLLITLAMLVGLGWIVPHANQDWREAIASMRGHLPVRGPRELTLVELFAAPPRATAEIWNRMLLIVLPLFFAAVRWMLPPIFTRFITGRVLSQVLWLFSTMLMFSFFRLTGFTAGLARGPYDGGTDGLVAMLLGMAVIASAFPQGDWRGHDPFPSRDRSIIRH